LVGIGHASPGFDKIRIAPRPTGTITQASGSTETRHGTLACSWKLEGSQFTAEITIPPNTTAEVILPVKGRVTERDKPYEAVDGKIQLGSGHYTFHVTP
jgi:alpha-L-rhamnosidase